MSAAHWRESISRILAEQWPTLQRGVSWIEAQVAQESDGDPRAVSEAGAVGLLQLMPATARELGLIVDEPQIPGSLDERLIPEKNLRAGITYLKRQYDQLPEIPGHRDRLLWAFAAYNCGRGFIDFDGGRIHDTALELAKRDEPGKWWQWEVGRYWLMHHDCVVVRAGLRLRPDYRQVWDYVARIRRRADSALGDA